VFCGVDRVSITNCMKTVQLGTPDHLRDSARRARKQVKGRVPDAPAVAAVHAVLGQAPLDGYPRDLLIEHLHALNDAHGALHKAHLVALAQAMRMGLAQVYEVASFYHHFHILEDGQLAPRLTLRVCNGLSCTLAGADDLFQQLQAQMDPGVQVLHAPCVGRCEAAPVAVVHQRAVGHANVGLVQACVAAGAPPEAPLSAQAWPQAPQAWCEPVHPECIARAEYVAAGGYRLLADVAAGRVSAASVLQTMEDSGLRGLGGAGFPLGRKWRIVRDQPGPRYLAVNIDEGEPGTFKDRFYLERDPHRFLEGMLLAARVVGCERIYIYLRDEYHGCRATLTQALAELQAQPPCPFPLIELRRGAGAYICGEESAMLESIEGRRGEPRLRPPYIAEKGLWGRPTLAHNFETLYWVREIAERGAAHFAQQGRHGRTGWRSFSVSGRVREPGVKLAPAGITLQELIDEHCGGMAPGHTLYAYLPGGASGGILPARLANVPLDFDTLQAHGCFIGSAAIVVLGHQDQARDAALNVMQFFADESCGQCTPCRVGTEKSAALMQAPVWDAHTLQDLAQVMGDASICGLGQAAPNPIACVLRYFPHEVGAGPELAP
jgi:formate dehydrogenase